MAWSVSFAICGKYNIHIHSRLLQTTNTKPSKSGNVKNTDIFIKKIFFGHNLKIISILM